MARRLGGGATVRAIDALAAISGNLGVAGGGASFYYKRGGAFRKLTRGIEVAPRTICEPLFGPAVLAARDPPIRALWVTAGNPVAMLPESETVAEAVRSREFVVVVDSWMSDTARLADLVLPVTTLLEADDLLGAYGHHHIGVAEPVVAPPPKVKTDLQIFQALAPYVGLDDYLKGSAAEVKQLLLGDALRARGTGIEELKSGREQRPEATQILFADGAFATPSGKVELIDAPPPRPPDAPMLDDRYPLSLLSLSTPKSQSSQWAKGEPPAYLEATVHPEVAGAIADGDFATLSSRRASLTVKLRHDPRQRRDVVIVPKGGHYHNRTSANLLITARTTDIGEGGALYDEPVRLDPVDGHA
jgi:anaerobic selenocysteine-containing dehydrogenase